MPEYHIGNCKHLNGDLLTYVDTAYRRKVKDGRVRLDGVNVIGGILRFSFCCFDCGNWFECRIVDGKAKSHNKWLEDMINQLSVKEDFYSYDGRRAIRSLLNDKWL